ncbi:hypothetical protein [Actinokineospora globicatena]|uniref:Uncharacterized protein n=1 Tax=Actinokineospora globicatena TaxID=103729 RepID=A0A9W6QKT8_9PSEU|nr:hypothetical protein [Actinokineospora globicatena]GLW92836.1 hypothetical protein Aglo03_36520 [Actinokineospora globicatena]
METEYDWLLAAMADPRSMARERAQAARAIAAAAGFTQWVLDVGKPELGPMELFDRLETSDAHKARMIDVCRSYLDGGMPEQFVADLAEPIRALWRYAAAVDGFLSEGHQGGESATSGPA